MKRFFALSSENATCTLLLIWNKSYLQWLKIPCDQRVLDRRSVYCAGRKMNPPKEMFVDNQDTWTVTTRHSTTRVVNYFQCETGKYVSTVKLCNGIRDCEHGDDETICNSTLYERKFYNLLICVAPTLSMPNKHTLQNPRIVCIDQNLTSHSIKEERKAKPSCGNKFCFEKCPKCMYNIKDRQTDRSVFPCSSGKHLDHCEDETCDESFKCLNYYCVSWRYVCDGYWDCPGGYDESHCYSSNIKPGFFHCSGTLIFISLQSVCDSFLDCPDGIDETLCQLKYSKCPTDCLCIGFTMLCCITKFFEVTHFPDFVHKNLVVFNVSTSDGIQTFLGHFENLQILHLTNNRFPTICDLSRSMFLNLMFLALPSNNIETLGQKCLTHFPNVTFLTFQKNNISELYCETFLGMYETEVLILSENRLITMKTCFFSCLRKLKYVSMSQNDIKSFDKIIFPVENICLNTSNVAMFCFDQTLQCSGPVETKSICKPLLKHITKEFTGWLFGISCLLLNALLLLSVAWKGRNTNIPIATKETKKAFQVIVRNYCVPPLSHSAVLLSLLVKHASFRDEFVLTWGKWHMSFWCQVNYFSATFSFFHSFFVLMLINISRYKIVADPLHTNFKDSNFVSRLFAVSFGVIVAFSTASTVLKFSFLETQDIHWFCIPFGSYVHISYVINVVFVTFGITFPLVEAVIIILMLWRLKNPPMTQQAASSLKPATIVRSLTAGLSHVLTWFPSSFMILHTCVLPQKDGEIKYELITWTLFCIITINALIYPFLLFSRK